MPAVCRVGDGCTGHGCHPPRKSLENGSTVTSSSRNIHCVGDPWEIHNCGDDTHDGVTASGSPDVMVGGKPVGRVGDRINCGSVIAAGDSTVFIN